MNSLISVIVPIFNAERFLPQCVDSILKQSYSNIEVVLVDDGSTDASSGICDEYALKDKRVVVLHKKNEGLVSARKTGVSLAHGDYILFVDSDDWIENDMIDTLNNYAMNNEADVVLSAVTIVCDNVYTYKSNAAEPGVYCGERLELLKKRLFLWEEYFAFSILPYLWNKLWRKTLIEDNLFCMDESITVGEDVAIGFPAILQTNKIVITEKSFYNYRQNSLSMLNNIKDQKKEFENAKKLYSYLKRRFEYLGQEENERGLRHYYINQMMTRAYTIVNQIMDCKGCFPFMQYADQPIVIYGAGVFGTSVYDYAKNHYNIKAWIDSNANNINNVKNLITTLDDAEIELQDLVIVPIINERVAKDIKDILLLKGLKRDNIKLFGITEEQEDYLLV